MEVNKYHVGATQLDVSFIKDDAQRAYAQSLIRILQFGVASMFWFKGIYDDMVRCRRIIDIYPKKRRPIPRAEYLHLIWVLFINLCYLLEERAKYFGERFNLVVDTFGVGTRMDVGALVRKIDRELGAQIRARGAVTHQALAGNKHIIEYGTFEFLHRLGEWPEGLPPHERIFNLTKGLVDLEMRSANYKAKIVVAEALAVAANEISDAIVKFNAIYELLKTKWPTDTKSP